MPARSSPATLRMQRALLRGVGHELKRLPLRLAKRLPLLDSLGFGARLAAKGHSGRHHVAAVRAQNGRRGRARGQEKPYRHGDIFFHSSPPFGLFVR
jgi:hypothetical protein